MDKRSEHYRNKGYKPSVIIIPITMVDTFTEALFCSVNMPVPKANGDFVQFIEMKVIHSTNVSDIEVY